MISDIYWSAQKPTSPFLLVQQGNKDLPKHPDGGNWVYWKQQDLTQKLVGIDGAAASAAIASVGHYIQRR